jgi:hypothetical protein
MSQHAHRAWATRCCWQVRLVVQEAEAEASRELTVRGDLISDNEAGTGQAAVWLGSRRCQRRRGRRLSAAVGRS